MPWVPERVMHNHVPVLVCICYGWHGRHVEVAQVLTGVASLMILTPFVKVVISVGGGSASVFCEAADLAD